MAESASLYPFSPDLKPERRWGLWIALILLTLVLHFLSFQAPVAWSPPHAPPRVDVTQVDPHKLEQIRQRWREQAKLLDQEKGVLLDKNQPKSETAPRNARYMSDKNITVEKEQIARNPIGLPKPGSPSQAKQLSQKQAEQKSQPEAQNKSKSPARSLPKLGNLGVPFRLNEAAQPKPQQKAQRQQDNASTNSRGGEQSIVDDSLPEGSENMLNAQESVYYSFFSRMYEILYPNWVSMLHTAEASLPKRPSPGDYLTSVDAVLDKEGNVIDVRLLESSRIHAFDEVGLDVWRKIGKFANPPSGLIKADGNIHIGFSFLVRVGADSGGVEFMPPQRNY